MIAFAGVRVESVRDIFAIFRQGSRCDPYVKAIGPQYTCHPDGWGFILYDGATLQHHRSSRPVWEDDNTLPTLPGKSVFGIFHSRFASDSSLNSPICSHPFMVATESGVLFLAHNGSVQAEFSPGSKMVDSEWAFSKIVRAGGLGKALSRLKERTRPNSALNLILMEIPRDKPASPRIECLNFHKSNDPGRAKYYEMHTADFAGGRLFFSSTFKDLATSAMTNVQPASPGGIFELGGKPAETGERGGAAGRREAVLT